MRKPLNDPKQARAAERDFRIGSLVFGTSLMLMALSTLLQSEGDLTVRLILLVVGIGAALWARSRAAGMRESAFGPAISAAFAWRRVLIVALILWLLMAFSDRSLSAKVRALFVGVFGTLIVASMMRPATAPEEDRQAQ